MKNDLTRKGTYCPDCGVKHPENNTYKTDDFGTIICDTCWKKDTHTQDLPTIAGAEWCESQPVKVTYDCYEVHPVKDIGPEMGYRKEEDGTCFEQCEPEEAEMWSVYGHTTGEGLECVADCDTKAIAENISSILTEKLANLKN